MDVVHGDAHTGVLHGPPPEVVWLRPGNCSTDDMEHAIRDAKDGIEEFGRDEVGLVGP